MKKTLFVGTVLVLVMIASAGAAEVKVDPASQTVAAGNNFQVNVVVEDVDDVKGDAAILNFAPGAMQVTGIVEGDFLKAGGSTIGVPSWNNTAGTATFGYTLWGTFSTVSGSGTLATIRFDTYPDAPADRYDLNLTNVELRNASNELIPIAVSNGTVTILNDAYQRGDLNHDNEITPADAVIAVRIAAGSHPFDDAADVSGDGRVTALDALMILQAAVGAIEL
ncbi:MAG: dockerin type I domain-containing protein [Euryarchaeota archaeon]|nr:dockerin type I domain-containing protein [Euryarchaeota archaeon]